MNLDTLSQELLQAALELTRQHCRARRVETPPVTYTTRCHEMPSRAAWKLEDGKIVLCVPRLRFMTAFQREFEYTLWLDETLVQETGTRTQEDTRANRRT